MSTGARRKRARALSGAGLWLTVGGRLGLLLGAGAYIVYYWLTAGQLLRAVG